MDCLPANPARDAGQSPPHQGRQTDRQPGNLSSGVSKHGGDHPPRSGTNSDIQPRDPTVAAWKPPPSLRLLSRRIWNPVSPHPWSDLLDYQRPKPGNSVAQTQAVRAAWRTSEQSDKLGGSLGSSDQHAQRMACSTGVLRRR